GNSLLLEPKGNEFPFDHSQESQVRMKFRSEERRVGKECRSRWWPYYLKKEVATPAAGSSCRTCKGEIRKPCGCCGGTQRDTEARTVLVRSSLPRLETSVKVRSTR